MNNESEQKKYCRCCGTAIFDGGSCSNCGTTIIDEKVNLSNKYKIYAIFGTLFLFLCPVISLILMVSAKKKYGFRIIIKILYTLNIVVMSLYIILILLITLYNIL